MTHVKLLIIDDTADWRALLCALFTSITADIDIVEAEDGTEAMRILSTTTDFDLIVSDYTMPNGTGACVFKFMKERQINIPFILFTALTDYNLRQFDGNFFAGVAPKHDIKILQNLVKDVLFSNQTTKQLEFSFT